MMSPLRQINLPIEGMSCASCVGRVEAALAGVPGVAWASVNLATETAAVALRPGADADALVTAVERAGYAARVLDESVPTVDAHRHDAGWRVALAALLSAPLALPMLGDLLGAHWTLPAGCQFLLATPVQFWLGARFYRARLRALRAGSG